MYTSLVTENRLTVMIDLIALNGQYLHTLPLILFTLPTIRYKNRHLKQRILSMFQPTKRIRSAGMHFRYVRSRFLGKRFSRDLGVPYSFVVIVCVYSFTAPWEQCYHSSQRFLRDPKNF